MSCKNWKGAAHFQRCNSRRLLRVPASSSTGGMRTLKVSGSREVVGRSSISMIGYGCLWRYEGEARGRGENEGGCYSSKDQYIEIHVDQ